MFLINKRPSTDPKAFEEAVFPYERQVYFLCLRLMKNQQDAEDCAQDTMLRAFSAFASFRGEAKVSTWLYRIATNLCMDRLRKNNPVVSYDALADDGWEIADDTASLYDALEENERKKLLSEAISALPDHYRIPVVLVDLHGLTYEEASDAMSIPIGTLRSRISRARKQMLKELLNQRELFTCMDRPNGERSERDEL